MVTLLEGVLAVYSREGRWVRWWTLPPLGVVDNPDSWNAVYLQKADRNYLYFLLTILINQSNTFPIRRNPIRRN